jgi:hypothetical protein
MLPKLLLVLARVLWNSDSLARGQFSTREQVALYHWIMSKHFIGGQHVLSTAPIVQRTGFQQQSIFIIRLMEHQRKQSTQGAESSVEVPPAIDSIADEEEDSDNEEYFRSAQ